MIGLKIKETPIRGMKIYHNSIKPYEGLDGMILLNLVGLS